MAIFLLGPDPDGNCCDCTGRTSPCDSCGEPAECQCALLIGKNAPAFELPPIPYDSYVDAQTAIAAQVGNCYAFADSFGGSITINSVTADVSVANQITITGDVDSNGVTLWTGFTIDESGTLSIAFNSTFASSPVLDELAAATLFNCSTYAEVATDIDSGTSGTLTLTGFSAGTYFLKLVTNCLAAAPLNATVSFVVSSNVTMVPNPVIAIWDDAGTDRQLEACPKMLLPPLTESSGSWYASLAAAQAIIDGENVANSNCIAYIDATVTPLATYFSSWSFSGLTLSGTRNGVPVGTPFQRLMAYISVNGTAGATLTWTWTNTPKSGMLVVYDYDGTQLYSSVANSTITSSALPYTGRYIVRVGFNLDPSTSASGTLSSSASLGTANQIQALYGTTPLLDCPSRLDC